MSSLVSCYSCVMSNEYNPGHTATNLWEGGSAPPTLYADERRVSSFTGVFFPGAAVKQLGYTTQLMFYNSLFADLSSQFIISKS